MLVVDSGTSGMIVALVAKTNSNLENVDSTLDVTVVVLFVRKTILPIISTVLYLICILFLPGWLETLIPISLFPVCNLLYVWIYFGVKKYMRFKHQQRKPAQVNTDE